jgi:hypothetical protein
VKSDNQGITSCIFSPVVPFFDKEKNSMGRSEDLRHPTVSGRIAAVELSFKKKGVTPLLE